VIDTDRVRAYLRLPNPSADDDLLTDVVDAVNVWVGRLDWVAAYAAAADPVGTWPATAEQGATMLAARMFRRRNTPSGVEAMTDQVVYVPRRDSDVDQLLRVGSYQLPAVG
jgi:hypothetical protein